MSNINLRKYWTEFLELYESLPTLWKVKSPEYSNRILKNAAYEEMVEKLKEIEENANHDMVVRKINTFRSNYRRDLKKLKNSKKSGTSSENVFESSLWYFNILSFLEEQEGVLEGRSTIDDIENTSEVPTAKKKRNMTEEDDLIKLACEHLKDSANDVMSKGWASQYGEMSSKQKVIARKNISDVLFHGCLGHLNENMPNKIQNVLSHAEVQTSTPLRNDLSNSSSLSSSMPSHNIIYLNSSDASNLQNEDQLNVQTNYSNVQQFFRNFEV